jgi:DNA polymerase elongation subunit (family B)
MVYKGAKDMKLLFYDIEVALQLGYFYDQWNTNIPGHKIKHRGFLLSAAWKWHGKDKIYSVSLLDDPKRFKKNYRDDFHIVKTLAEQINEADAICAFNGDNFDIRELNTGLVLHGQRPLHQAVQIDPYKIAKKHFRFKGGNSLRNLCHVLGVSCEKLKVDDDIWIKAAEGDVKALKFVEKRCMSDIPTMIEVYEKLKPFAPAKINMNHFVKEVDVCPSCGHPEFVKYGVMYLQSGPKQQWQCQKCFHQWRDTKAKRPKHA